MLWQVLLLRRGKRWYLLRLGCDGQQQAAKKTKAVVSNTSLTHIVFRSRENIPCDIAGQAAVVVCFQINPAEYNSTISLSQEQCSMPDEQFQQQHRIDRKSA
jgi:hypothetical protein